MDVGGTDVDICVAVGDTITTAVAVIPADDVSVGDGSGGTVDVDSLDAEVCVADDIGREEVAVNSFEADVSVSDGNGGIVIVDVLDVDVPVDDAIGGTTVVVTNLVAVTEIADRVVVGVQDCGAFAGTHNNRQINNNNRMMATISLNRS